MAAKKDKEDKKPAPGVKGEKTDVDGLGGFFTRLAIDTESALQEAAPVVPKSKKGSLPFSFLAPSSPKHESKNVDESQLMFCFSFSNSLAEGRLDNVLAGLHGPEDAWTRLRDSGANLKARPYMKEILTGLINQNHKVAIFTGINHPQTTKVIQGFLADSVGIDKNLINQIRIEFAQRVQGKSKTKSAQLDDLRGDRRRDQTVVIDGEDTRASYVQQLYVFIPVGGKELFDYSGAKPTSPEPEQDHTSSAGPHQ
jgi:hypothetical protein